ncbi:hypothetical protein M9H77_06102 [Catharanthus roseus]|uniref:Uncharacterized protein n=1 Tax=Catharanthus roseus TaxID=4058 RepID=A0ACC0BRD1_CATRO|nr:hypothetical protein M9H77_06102 [Catharanthus roseus]
MENKESEEPQRKRPHLDSASTDNSKPVSFACSKSPFLLLICIVRLPNIGCGCYKAHESRSAPKGMERIMYLVQVELIPESAACSAIGGTKASVAGPWSQTERIKR